MKERIALAMSGGVDSAVSAFLLKEAGFDVTGFHLRLWSDPACPAGGRDDEAADQAVRAAERLGIPLRVIEAGNVFKEKVVDYFSREYADLRTPNPCVVCNRFIKFGWLLEKVAEAGFDRIATGHYARIEKDADGIFHLLAGIDERKDQSYFLHQLDQVRLSRIVFPVGGMPKSEVREIARKLGLESEGRKESQEVCFIRDGNYREFLKRHSRSRFFAPGDAVDRNGHSVGRHNGLVGYTIGQRKGVEYSGINDDHRPPLYVSGFDRKGNRLMVGQESELYRERIKIVEAFWISDRSEKEALNGSGISAKLRYRHSAAECSVEPIDSVSEPGRFAIAFKEPQRAPAPGQFAVIYKEKEVLGGGRIIEEG